VVSLSTIGISTIYDINVYKFMYWGYVEKLPIQIRIRYINMYIKLTVTGT